jgi:ribose transport system permease protein
MSVTSETRPDAVATAPRRRHAMVLEVVRDYGIVVALAVMVIVLSISSSAFLTTTNFLNILDQWAPLGIIALGSTLVMIGGGFDLSVGAVYAVAGVVAVGAAKHVGAPLAFAAGCGAGLVVGIFNGVVVTSGRINPFVATLASQIMLRGVALAITGGLILTTQRSGFDVLGFDGLGSVRYTVFVWLAVFVLLAFVLQRTTFGRYVYAVGGNREAARLSGVRVNVVRASTYAISGLTAGIGGVLVASRLSTARADTGTGLELDAIAAIVIGGTSILGGEGALWRTMVGVFVLALIGNGFTLLNVDPTYQRVLYGAVLLGAVAIDAWSRRSDRGEA